MSELSAKITITAVDHVSNVVKGIGSQFEKLKQQFSGVTAAWGNVSNAGSALATKLTHLTLAAAGTGAAIYKLAEHYAEFSHQLLLSQSRTGVSAENLQRLAYSAKLFGVGTDGLNNGLRFLNRNIGNANLLTAKGKEATNLQAQAFKELGVSTKDSSGHLRNANDVLADVADKFHDLHSIAEKNRIAIALFGRAGASLIPWLSQGSEAIKKQGDELAKLGHILSGDELKANAKFEESIIKLKTAIGGLASIVASALIPVLQPIVDDMIKWISVNRDWLATNIKEDIIQTGHAFSEIWTVLKAVGSVLVPVISAFGGLKTVIAALTGIYIASLIVSFANLVKAVYSLGMAFAALDIALLPITGIVAAIALIGVGLYKLYSMFDEIKAAWIALWPTMQPYVETFANVVTLGLYGMVRDIITHWSELKSATQEAWAGIATIAQSIWAGIQDKVGGGIEILKNAMNTFIDIIKIAFSAITGVFDAFVNGVVRVKDVISNIHMPSFSNPFSSAPATSPQASNSPSAGLATAGITAAARLDNYLINPPSQLNSQQMAANNQPQKIDINMRIDADGRPTSVTATSNSPMSFKANTGKII